MNVDERIGFNLGLYSAINVIDTYQNMDELQLRVGELTAAEKRLAKAILSTIQRDIGCEIDE